jgi:DNA polymerase-3 subunit epsilon
MTIFVAFDIESTGLLAPDQRIIEIYCALYSLETKELIRSFEKRIDPQRSITAEAQRVHGISGADLIGCPTFEAVAPALRAFIEQGAFILAHNGDGFDIPFLNMELERVGLAKLTRPSIDTMIQGRYATHNGKVPTLGELCFAMGVEYDPEKAHAASYDVQVMTECFFRAADWGFLDLSSYTKDS